MTESVKIVALDSRVVMWEAKPVADVRCRSAKDIFILYRKINYANLFCPFSEKAKASEAFDKKISLALESSHQSRCKVNLLVWSWRGCTSWNNVEYCSNCAACFSASNYCYTTCIQSQEANCIVDLFFTSCNVSR